MLWLVFIACAVPAGISAQTDTAALKRTLQSTAAEYERALANKAPHKLMQNAFCSETIGRFCLIHDGGVGGPLPPEPEEVKKARARTLEAYKQAVAAWPDDSVVIGSMLRYLIEDERAEEAVTLARDYATRAADPAWADLLLGFALHAATQEASADEVFARALRRALPNERRAMHDVKPLLSSKERDVYEKLTGAARAQYLERLWVVSDPLFLTDGNESLNEHLSRYVYARILARAPAVDNLGWGPDIEVLTMRYGVPTAHTQSFGSSGGKQHVQHHSPEQLTYVPPALNTTGGLSVFEPGGIWPYDTIRVHSGFAPRTLRHMQVLAHQVARFPLGDSVQIRADLVLPTDSMVKFPARVLVGLFALDSAYDVIAAAVDTVSMDAPNRTSTISLRAPARTAAYSLEALDLGTRLAARGRYIFAPRTGSRPVLSDLVILPGTDDAPPASRAEPSFQPLPSLVIKQGDPIAIYIEARGLTRA